MDEQLKIGTDAELEHKALIIKLLEEAGKEPTDAAVRDIASKIAADHLKEDSEYYTKLKKMEGNSMKNENPYSGEKSSVKVNGYYGCLENDDGQRNKMMCQRALDLMEILDKREVNYTQLGDQFFKLWDQKAYGSLHYVIDQLAKLVDRTAK